MTQRRHIFFRDQRFILGQQLGDGVQRVQISGQALFHQKPALYGKLLHVFLLVQVLAIVDALVEIEHGKSHEYHNTQQQRRHHQHSALAAGEFFLHNGTVPQSAEPCTVFLF